MTSNQKPEMGNGANVGSEARATAVRVLHRVLSGEAFASAALDNALSREQLPPRDAGLTTHIVYGTLRYLPALRLSLEPLLRGKTNAKARTLLLAGTFEKLHLDTPDHAAVNEYVALARRMRFAPPGLVNAVLRRVQAPTGSDSVARFALPEWIFAALQQVYGPQAEVIAADLLAPQPLWLKVWEGGARALEDEGNLIESTLAGIDRVVLTRPLGRTAAYQRGLVQPINPASAAVVAAVVAALPEVANQQVYDLAGGAGIKAALLAKAGAKVTSVEVQAHKHKAATTNLRRLGVADSAQLITHDLRQPLDLPPAPTVLLDAPCTGSGTLRAHPEIKARLEPKALAELAELQAKLLRTAAEVVATGGTLMYSVCSFFPAEGPEQVRRFLQQHPDFQPAPLPQLGLEMQQAEVGAYTVPIGGVDGFYMARLLRK